MTLGQHITNVSVLAGKVAILVIGCIFSRPYYKGRAIGTVLRLSSSSSSVTSCIVAKRCVLQQKLLLRAYRKSYMRNRLVPKCLCLDFVSRSRQTLRYIWRWISRKPLEIEAWFQRTTNTKWHMGYRMVTWPMTSRDLERSNSWPQYA